MLAARPGPAMATDSWALAVDEQEAAAESVRPSPSLRTHTPFSPPSPPRSRAHRVPLLQLSTLQLKEEKAKPDANGERWGEGGLGSPCRSQASSSPSSPPRCRAEGGRQRGEDGG